MHLLPYILMIKEHRWDALRAAVDEGKVSLHAIAGLLPEVAGAEEMLAIIDWFDAAQLHTLAENSVHYNATDMVCHLLPKVQVNDDWLAQAAYGECVPMVKLLLNHCDPKFGRSTALNSAVLLGNVAIMNILFPVSDPQQVLDDILADKDWSDYDGLPWLQEQLNIQQHNTLMQHVEHKTDSNGRKM